MKKIMFDDKFGLTKAVLEGRKTMTRRVVPEKLLEAYYDYDDYVNAVAPHDIPYSREYEEEFFLRRSRFKVGEVVAVAQSYKDVRNGGYPVDSRYDAFRDADWGDGVNGVLKCSAGENNKMFVRADLMPHQIRITGFRVERLQDICDEDCYREGIYKKTLCPPGDIDYFYHSEPRSKWEVYPSAREAFAGLIDKVSGKGTWERNPWVFVYVFELVR